MTHDELLAVVQNSYSGIPDFEGNWKASQALRAVVELHKSVLLLQEIETEIVCEGCDFDYPCPTIQAIERELEQA
jgi:hypothetical protein